MVAAEERPQLEPFCRRWLVGLCCPTQARCWGKGAKHRRPWDDVEGFRPCGCSGNSSLEEELYHRSWCSCCSLSSWHSISDVYFTFTNAEKYQCPALKYTFFTLAGQTIIIIIFKNITNKIIFVLWCIFPSWPRLFPVDYWILKCLHGCVEFHAEVLNQLWFDFWAFCPSRHRRRILQTTRLIVQSREETLQADRWAPTSTSSTTNTTFSCALCTSAWLDILMSLLMQNTGMIAGMMQKVNPFKSAQPKVQYVQPEAVYTVCCRLLWFLFLFICILFW